MSLCDSNAADIPVTVPSSPAFRGDEAGELSAARIDGVGDSSATRVDVAGDIDGTTPSAASLRS
jgi:hypothetical protein